MHHVKSEHDKDDDDDDLTDDDRKPDGIIGQHSGLSHHHPAYHHSMLGSYHHGIKEEMSLLPGSKNQSSSDCGIPIPATKPKIWSLADTAACKTPPPMHPQHGAWMTSGTGGGVNTVGIGAGNYHTTHHNPHQAGIPSGMIMGGGVGVPGHHMNMNMNINPHQQHQSMTGMGSGIANPHQFGNSPYSRYGGFLTGPHHYQTSMGPQIQQQPHQQQHQSQNTPLTPNSHSNSNSQSMGFPEVQTDTPPQTPPNMKLPSVAANLITITPTNSSTPANTADTPPNPMIGSCNYTNNNNNNTTTTNNNLNQNSSGNHGQIFSNSNSNASASPSPNTFLGSFTNLQQHSPQKLPQEYVTGQHHQDGSTAFKPFYKRLVYNNN